MAALYQSIDEQNFAETLGIHKEDENDTYDTIVDYLKERIREDKIGDDMKNKVYVLHETIKTKKTHGSKRRKRMNAKEKRKLKLYDVKNEKLTYDQFIPLHDLWMSYMKSLLHVVNTNKTNEKLSVTLLKADYHGCNLAVTRSKCPSFVGISGIVIRESKNTFICITKDNQIKTLPKQNSVFSFRVDENLFTIYGNHFRVKASERSAKKFKSKPTIDL